MKIKTEDSDAEDENDTSSYYPSSGSFSNSSDSSSTSGSSGPSAIYSAGDSVSQWHSASHRLQGKFRPGLQSYLC